MKKLALVLAAALCISAGAFAEQPKTISFKNEVSSDTVRLLLPNENPVAGFAMYEVAGAEFEAERLDAAIQVGFHWLFPSEKYAEFDWDADALDYYVEFRPIEVLTVFFHDEVYTNGSRLFVASRNAAGNERTPTEGSTRLFNFKYGTAAGNLGSDFGLCWRPIGGLRIAAGADFLTGIGTDHSRPVINFGVDYTYGSVFSAGVTVRNPFSYTNKIAVGAFFSFTGVQGLTLNAGYTFRGGDFSAGDGGASGRTAGSPVTVPSVVPVTMGVVTTATDSTIGKTYNSYTYPSILGTHLIQLSANYAKNAFSGAFDFVIAPSAVNTYDLYAGADLGYKITDSVSADVLASFVADLDGSDPIIFVYPKAQFTFAQNHSVTAGVELQFEGSQFQLAFPVTYTFRYKI